MKSSKNNQRVSDRNQVMSISIMTSLGNREEQQDCFGYILRQYDGLIVLCDGMGGHEGGKYASNTAVECLLTAFETANVSNPVNYLLDNTKIANAQVCNIIDSNGQKINCGSTLVTIYINGNKLYWNSVGDSRAYLFRNGEFVQLTLDHNYLTVLNEKLNAKLISESEYEAEKVKGESLISFLGMGEMNLVDYNKDPLELYKDDRIIIMSDGLYKVLDDSEIMRIIENFNNIDDALQALELKANKNAKKLNIVQDNTTIAIIKMN